VGGQDTEGYGQGGRDFVAGFAEAIPFGARIALSRLSLLDLWLGLLLGDTGCSLERSGSGDDDGFYRRDGILVLGIDSFACAKSEAIDLGDGGTILKV
jgi:hypothetical protein